jgi:hypothetical protein
MLGGIYCGECGKRLFKGLCEAHPGKLIVSFHHDGKRIWRRFSDWDSAEQELAHLRVLKRSGSLDVRDWQKGEPNGFANQYDRFLTLKRKQIKAKSWNNLKNCGSRASDAWKNRNVKSIGYAEIEDFLFSQEVSDKTRANMRSALHDFWAWLVKRDVLKPHQMPRFPECPFELGFRKTIDKATQQNIIDEVKRISHELNPKIWIGIKWLATYISIRPGELVEILEDNLDREQGIIFLVKTKEKRPKIVPLIKEDVEILRDIPQGFPKVQFFRHVPGLKGIQAGRPFGPRYLYKWWMRACENLGIEGVDLYGGTRHSSARALLEFRTPEEIRRATMHSTNKAFERYFQMDSGNLRSIYEDTQGNQAATRMQRKRASTRSPNQLKRK